MGVAKGALFSMQYDVKNSTTLPVRQQQGAFCPMEKALARDLKRRFRHATEKPANAGFSVGTDRVVIFYNCNDYL